MPISARWPCWVPQVLARRHGSSACAAVTLEKKCYLATEGIVLHSVSVTTLHERRETLVLRDTVDQERFIDPARGRAYQSTDEHGRLISTARGLASVALNTNAALVFFDLTSGTSFKQAAQFIREFRATCAATRPTARKSRGASCPRRFVHYE
jgi:hypothetical protein